MGQGNFYDARFNNAKQYPVAAKTGSGNQRNNPGLFGLTLFTTEKRIREIGIRKILGASLTDILTLLTKDFVLLVIISLAIASPIAWFVMDKWLRDYAYRIPLSLDIFLTAGMGLLFVTLITIGFQSVKAALANPVKNLRTE